MAGFRSPCTEHTRLQVKRHPVYGDPLNYRFFTKWVAPDLRLIDIPEGAAADLGNEPITSCPIMLWVVGVPEWDLGDLLVRLGPSRASLEVVEYHEELCAKVGDGLTG